MGLNKMELWGQKFENPGLMEKAGLNFCLMQDGNTSTKFLPYNIGYCIARGLSLEKAFEAVTMAPAKILGLEDRVGSLEPGKDADLAIFSGNPFSNFTICEKTIIDGTVYVN